MNEYELRKELQKHTINFIQTVNHHETANGEVYPRLASLLERERRDMLAYHVEKARTTRVDYENHIEFRTSIVALPVDELHRLIAALATSMRLEELRYANYYQPTPISP